MYAIKNRKTNKWVYGTDYRYHPHQQRTSYEALIVFSTYDDDAVREFNHRQCGKDYDIVPIMIVER